MTRWIPYTEEMAVKMLIGGMTPEEVAAELGLCPCDVREWLAERRNYLRDNGDA